MIPLFIASKNRASQLRLLLESLNKNCSDLFEINILYSFDENGYQDGYKKLQDESIANNIEWQQEDKDSNGVFVRQFYDFLDHNPDHFALMVDDNVFYSHLVKRDKFVSELETLKTKNLKHDFDEIAYEDKYLTEYIIGRKIYGIDTSDDMKNYEPYDIDRFKDTLLGKEDLNNALWVIASDLRELTK